MTRFLKLHGKHVDEVNFYHSFVELDQRAYFEIEEKTKTQSNFEWLAHRQVSTLRLSLCTVNLNNFFSLLKSLS